MRCRGKEEIVADRDVMKRLRIKIDGTELYEEFQKLYDESISRDADKEREEDKMRNSGRGR